MPWDTSDRKSRLPDDWSIRRMRVLRRDAYRCQARDSEGRLCGEWANQCDHVVAGDDHDLDNLQALCQWHHARKSSQEGAAARKPRPTMAAPAEPHPAFIRR
jgi:nitrite reductase/ring-hydroxylating ferredoxin subunit